LDVSDEIISFSIKSGCKNYRIFGISTITLGKVSFSTKTAGDWMSLSRCLTEDGFGVNWWENFGREKTLFNSAMADLEMTI
jgi:hypothetical protein